MIRSCPAAAATALAWIVLLTGTTLLHGQSVTISEYPVPASGPLFIAPGPDGALWFTETLGNKIGRITTAGIVTEYPLPTPGSQPAGITAGPDGAIWFTEFAGRIGRITTKGVISEYPIPTPDSTPSSITTGPDGALWFTEQVGAQIGRITTAGVIREFQIPSGGFAYRIVSAPDGTLWFAESSGIGQITTAGVVINEYQTEAVNSQPVAITLGPDGNLWFVQQGTNLITKITTNPVFFHDTQVPLTAGQLLTDIAPGPDGALWFIESDSSKIGRITTSGKITATYTLPLADSGPNGIVKGPDGALWFTEFFSGRIGRAVVNPPVAGNAVTVSASPPELTITVDGVNYTGSQSFNWAVGEKHSIGVTSPQPDGSGTRYVFSRWSDSGSQAHSITVTSPTAVYTAALNPQYHLTTSVSPPGSGSILVNPATTDGFYDAGTPVQFTAIPSANFQLAFWSSDLAGDANPQLLTMAAPRQVQANFTGSGPTSSVSFSEFPIPTANAQPWLIAAGPDGALWFTENNASRIGRITTIGLFQEFPLPGTAFPLAIAAGTDGALWFTDNAGKIGRITTAGAVTEYPLPAPCPFAGAIRSLAGIAAGPDGALWFTENDCGVIGRITTDGTITEFATSAFFSAPYGITAGPDGAMWFVENFASQVGRITTKGAITEFPIPTPASGPTGIATGSDGALWFTEGNAQQIGRITTSGLITETAAGSGDFVPFQIVGGPDSALWITGTGIGQIGRLTTAGIFHADLIPTSLGAGNPAPFGIAAGPDGALWFTENQGNRIGRAEPPRAVTCTTYSLPQGSQAFPAAGGTGSAALRAPAGALKTCGWTATSNVPWVTITGGGSGAGNGNISFAVAANASTSPRSGTLTIAGQIFAVTQAGSAGTPSCAASSTGAARQVAIEGRTELLADYVLTCSGFSGALPADITLTLNTNVTNALVNDLTDAQLSVNGNNPRAALVAGYNAIRWTAVTLSPINGLVTLRISNVRADASQLLPQRKAANPENFQPTKITGQASIGAAVAVPVTAAVQTLASAVQSLVFTRNQAMAGTGAARTLIPLVYQEGQAGSFQTSVTRVRVALSNVPPGVQIYAPIFNSDGAKRAQLYSADSNGLGGTPVAGSLLPEGLYQQVNVNAGAATATWVVLAADPAAVESLMFPLLALNAGTDLANGLSVSASLAPVSDVTIPSATAPIPRYRDFSVQPRLTNLRVTTSAIAQAAAPPLIKPVIPPAPRAAPAAFLRRDTATPGSNITFTTQIVNDTTDGSQSATGVMVRSNLPSGLSLAGCSASGGGSCGESGNQVQVSYPALAPGDSRTVTITARVDSSFTGDSLESPVTASSDEVNLDLLAATSSTSLVFSSGLPATVSGGPTAGAGTAQNFTFQFSHPLGYENLSMLNVLFNNGPDGRNACYLAYAVQPRMLYLVNDNGNAAGPYAGSVPLGGTSTIENSQCAVGLVSALGSGTTLALTLKIAFKGGFAGNLVSYVATQDQAGNNSDWQVFGVWQVPGAPVAPMSVTGVAPAQGSAPAGTYQQFWFTLADIKGTGDFGVVDVLINSSLDGRKACYLAFAASSNMLYLVDDAGDGGGPFAGSLPLNGGPQAIENGQCAVALWASQVGYAANTMNLVLTILFKPEFRGTRVIYAGARDQGGAGSTGWQAVGVLRVE